MAAHAGQYPRKVIVDKVIPSFADKATEIVHENGRMYVIKLTLPEEWETFLDYYDTQEFNQRGMGYIYRKSPLMYADPTENNHLYGLTCFKRKT